jgi:hypothetical protein
MPKEISICGEEAAKKFEENFILHEYNPTHLGVDSLRLKYNKNFTTLVGPKQVKRFTAALLCIISDSESVCPYCKAAVSLKSKLFFFEVYEILRLEFSRPASPPQPRHGL